MPAGDIHFSPISITLDYLAPADTVVTFVEAGTGYPAGIFDILNSTIVDVTGRNSKRKTVVTILARQQF